MLARSLLIAVALTLGVAAPARAWGEEAPTPQAIAKAAFPGTVMLVMQEAGTDRVSQGTGFFVAPGLVVTNFHVIAGAATGSARIIGQPTPYAVTGVAAFDRARDLAILRLADAPAVTPLPRGDASALAVADTLYAVGNPRGLEGTFSEGILSSIRQRDGETMLQITTPISEGSSGGPVIDARGRVVGVAVGMLREGQNLNFAIPVTAVEKLLAAVHAPIPLADLAGPPDEARVDCGAFSFSLPPNWTREDAEAATFRASREGASNALLTVFARAHGESDLDGYAGKAIAALGRTYLGHKVISLAGERAYLIMYKSEAETGPVFASDVRVLHGDTAYTVSLWSDLETGEMKAISEEFEALARSWRWK